MSVLWNNSSLALRPRSHPDPLGRHSLRHHRHRSGHRSAPGPAGRGRIADRRRCHRAGCGGDLQGRPGWRGPRGLIPVAGACVGGLPALLLRRGGRHRRRGGHGGRDWARRPRSPGSVARVFTGERLGGRWTAATALACAGVTLLVLGSGAGGAVSAGGVGLALLAGAGYSGYAVASKRMLDSGARPEAVMAAVFGMGAVLLLPVFAIVPAGGLAHARRPHARPLPRPRADRAGLSAVRARTRAGSGRARPPR